jgi:hypothetical protein
LHAESGLLGTAHTSQQFGTDSCSRACILVASTHNVAHHDLSTSPSAPGLTFPSSLSLFQLRRNFYASISRVAVVRVEASQLRSVRVGHVPQCNDCHSHRPMVSALLVRNSCTLNKKLIAPSCGPGALTEIAILIHFRSHKSRCLPPSLLPPPPSPHAHHTPTLFYDLQRAGSPRATSFA